ncbi:hypothetical protein M569_04036 [Genlisea aurea]|uniref:SHSP domain-containing protein n=1 Tax=Genlisea aurea TaxID=192259 RepID=S8EDS5_9LAMI|nr:hypothetical protein M569_04036 [Genlisea aurea]
MRNEEENVSWFTKTETPVDYVYKINVSGRSEDVYLQVIVVEYNVLKVIEMHENESAGYINAIRVPDDGRLNKAKAVIDGVVLTITVPKGEGNVPKGIWRIIEITRVGSGDSGEGTNGNRDGIHFSNFNLLGGVPSEYNSQTRRARRKFPQDLVTLCDDETKEYSVRSIPMAGER